MSTLFQRVPNFGLRPTTVEKDSRPETAIEAAQSEGEPLAYQGYIEKRGGPTNPAYKSRYLVLTRYGNVRYFKDKKSTAKLGCFKLHDSIDLELFNQRELRLTTDERIWEFRFINVEIRAAWFLSFQEVANQMYLWSDDDNNDTARVLASLRLQYKELVANKALPDSSEHVVAKAEKSIRPSMTNRNSLSAALLAKIRNGENNRNYTVQKLLELQKHSIARPEGTNAKMPLRVMNITWNLAEYLPDMKELDFLQERLGSEAEDRPTLVVVNVQECQSLLYNVTDGSIDELAPVEIWRTMVQTVLGRQYTIVANRTMGAIQCTVYCKVNQIHMISHMTVNHVACGIGNVFQNKGAVGIAFKVYGTSIAFVCAHLPAHQNKVQERNSAYQRIDQLLTQALITGDESTPPVNSSQMNKVISSQPGQSLMCANFDYVFFAGDFNYRVDCRDVGRFLQMISLLQSLEKKLGTNTTSSKGENTMTGGQGAQRSIATLIECNRARAETLAHSVEPTLDEEDDEGSAPLEAASSGGWAMDAEEDELIRRFNAWNHEQALKTEAAAEAEDPSSPTRSTGAKQRMSTWAVTAEEYGQKKASLEETLHKEILDKLLSTDQLVKAMKNGQAFTGYEEPNISFCPTYKFIPDTEEYSCSVHGGRLKGRIPAWCDRILYKKQPAFGDLSVETRSYECAHGTYHSDHRAVVAEFEIKV